MPVKLARRQIGQEDLGRGVHLDVTAKSSSGIGIAFAPRWGLVSDYKNGKIDEDQYKDVYFKQLDKIPPQVITDLYMQCLTEGLLVLLCYCPDGGFCHTYLLMEWLQSRHPKLFGW